MKKKGVFIVVFLIFFSLFINPTNSSLEENQGCYLQLESDNYCQVITKEEAEDVLFFHEKQDCSQFEECKEVLCTVGEAEGCEILPLGKCQSLGGKEIDEINEFASDWCSEGCCHVGDFCGYVYSKASCLKKAWVQGLDENNIFSWITKLTNSSLTPLSCQKSCQSKILSLANLTVCVLNETKEIINEAKIEIKGIASEGKPKEGCFEYELTPKNYLIKAQAKGYGITTQLVSLTPGENKKINLTLPSLETSGQLEGYVFDKEGNPLPQATISWEGLTSGSVLTNGSGFYSISELVLNNTYLFSIGKEGYLTQKKEITLTEGKKEENFSLEKIAFQGIKGFVYYLEEENKIPAEGAALKINGVLKQYTQNKYTGKPGYFEIFLEPGEYELSAFYYDYELKEKINFSLKEGQKSFNLTLEKYIGVCSLDGPEPQKNIEFFAAEPILGEKKIKLIWKKPCPEVIGYKLYKEKKEKEDSSEETSEKVIKTASPNEFFYIDTNVEWGETYLYKIEAIYGENRSSEEKTEVSFTLGDPECEGKYFPELQTFATFCLVEEDKRKKIWTCNQENKLEEVIDCSSLGPNSYCAFKTEQTAICKDAGSCGWEIQEAGPFGLYYEKQKCYGVETENNPQEGTNYCYFDYSPTIVDRCASCTEIESCFDYQSKDACEINNCLGTNCIWVEGAAGLTLYSSYQNILLWPLLEETGHGYCVEENYQKEDKCPLCSPQSELFENYYCTGLVCSNLGRCFANKKLTRCESCGEKPDPQHNCYSYQTEIECVGSQKQPLTINELGEITFSQDTCGWERCRWDTPGSQGQCIKDGDADGQDDCIIFSPSEQAACHSDNQAPSTTLVPSGINIISQTQPFLTFSGQDNFFLGVLRFCLDQAEKEKCTNFKEVPYQGKSSEELKINIFTSFLEGEEIKGKTYRLRYYSKDKYFNQENIKEDFIFIDTEPPQFEINSLFTTEGDTTDLAIFLEGLNEPMSCLFELKPLFPLGETLVKEVPREEKEKEVVFSELKGIIYNLTVSCQDDYHNFNNKTKQFTFDLEQGIKIIKPIGAVKSQLPSLTLVFEIETDVAASCQLLTLTGEKVADFNIIDEVGKKHQTKPLPNFIEGNYANKYKVVCQELLTQETKEDYFDFQVDFTGPQTQINLEEGLVSKKPIKGNWEESFIENVFVSFTCESEGFPCSQTYYCLGEGCEYKKAPGYTEFTEPFSLNETTKICYYSLDSGENEGPLLCGKILIEGHGIVLLKPEAHYYQEELWGISNKPIFDWEILTKIPTQECKFDFTEGFDYENLPLYKILPPGEEENHYLFKDFPGEVIKPYKAGEVKTLYLKCKDLNNQIGPSQKINLEYDPTPPHILGTAAQPNPLYEGNKITLSVDTDDKTLCKYSDHSEGEGTLTYDLMEYSFPGEKENILEINHQDLFTINFAGANKTYLLLIRCKNGAGNLSEVKNLTFFVDYSVLGNILSLEPSGYLNTNEVTLKVLTNKNAQCEYDGNLFEITGGLEHTQTLTSLTEGEHLFLITCFVGGEKREEQINFIIDLTPPQIKKVNDGNYSCSLEETPLVQVYTNETEIKGYYYELYDKDNPNLGVIKKGFLSQEPFKIKTPLIENHSYYFKISVWDKANNSASLIESDGFLAISKENPYCQEETAPSIDFVLKNESCTQISVELYCQDETSCSVLKYGQSREADACEPKEDYWQKILFNKTGWLCYYIEDSLGNNETGIKKIVFPDKDGDGILDSCDLCPETSPGKAVDEKGCASGEFGLEEKQKDVDEDGLPDYWEKLYNQEDCNLDWLNPDSDGNGLFDGDEDYDQDGFSNLEEFKKGSNPCLAEEIEEITSAKKEKEKEILEESLVPPSSLSSPQKEKRNILPWIFLFSGLLMVLGGLGYLLYFKPVPKTSSFKKKEILSKQKPLTKPSFDWRKKILTLKRIREKKRKSKERESFFDEFTSQSKEIPFLNEILQKKTSPLKKIEILAKKHQKIKDKIKPGLRPEEKPLFAKLEKIAQQTKDKKIEDILNQKETETIFDRLKEISKKRKEEKQKEENKK